MEGSQVEMGNWRVRGGVNFKRGGGQGASEEKAREVGIGSGSKGGRKQSSINTKVR